MYKFQKQINYETALFGGNELSTLNNAFIEYRYFDNIFIP